MRPRTSSLSLSPDAPALELTLFWRGTLLRVEHVTGDASFTVGDAGCDFVLPAPDGDARLVARAGGLLELPRDAEALSLRAGAASATPVATTGDYALAPDETLTLRWCGVTIVLRSVERAPAPPRTPPVRLRDHAWVGASLLAHCMLLLLFSLTPPSAAALSLDRLHLDSRLAEYVMVQNSIELEETPLLEPDEGSPGERAAGDEGEAGDREAPDVKRRAANKGPRNNPDPAVALGDAREHLRDNSILGVLYAMAPTGAGSIFGREQAEGSDAENAIGHLLGDRVGAARGLFGMGMLGTGRGGGGDGYGTRGLDVIGTIGTRGQGTGYGDPRAMRMRGHDTRVPKLRVGKPDVRGSLAKEVIRRVIHRNLARVRHCYEQELTSRPDLAGRVSVKFIIDQAGLVRASVVADSTLGNARAEQCIAHVVGQLTFPAPDGGGIVSVTYPFVLAQAGT